MPTVFKQVLSDSFPYANGDLHTLNANWVYDVGSFGITTNVCYATANPCLAYRADAGPFADQYSEATVSLTVVGGTQNCGPGVRIAAGANTGYYIQLATNLTQLVRDVAGSVVVLVTTGVSFATGDVCRLAAVGNLLTVYKNGAPLAGFTNILDTAIASGYLGQFGAGIATSNGLTSWAGGTALVQAGGLSPGFDFGYRE